MKRIRILENETKPSGSGSTKIIFVLRDLKASKADKATITGEVKVLLELKAKFKVLYVCMYVHMYVYLSLCVSNKLLSIYTYYLSIMILNAKANFAFLVIFSASMF